MSSIYYFLIFSYKLKQYQGQKILRFFLYQYFMSIPFFLQANQVKNCLFSKLVYLNWTVKLTIDTFELTLVARGRWRIINRIKLCIFRMVYSYSCVYFSMKLFHFFSLSKYNLVTLFFFHLSISVFLLSRKIFFSLNSSMLT